jgi:CheY-like chemotaxis protein
MNQEVITKHLERVGLRVVIAENGQEGVETVRARAEKGGKPFDLIFMDMHMPVMDGLEAAPKIMELNTGTPIVAMTANVMSQDKDLYKQNGMADCVGKPFTSLELWRCLLKYLTPVSWKAMGGNQGGESDEELRRRLIAVFVKNNGSKYAEVTDALDKGDIKLAHRLAHTLKSNAAMLEKTALQKAAADIESLLADGENRVTQAHLTALETELKAALEELAPLVQSSSPAAVQAEALETDQRRRLIEELEPRLEEGSPESLNHLDELRRIPGSEELIRQMESFEFDSARESLAELKKKTT